MKIFTSLLLSLLAFYQPNAQKKLPEPGKEQTIEFLSKRVKEIIGYNKLSITSEVFINKKLVTDGHLKKTATGIELFIAYKSGDFTYNTYYSFNPRHIVSIVNTSADNVLKDSPVGTLEITFIGKTVLYNNDGTTSNVDKAILNFLQIDPDNEAQIIKALLHLKSIFKEEDTLF